MVKIAFDLNDVYREFTNQFASYYTKEIDPTFDLDNLVYEEDNLLSPFKFETKQELDDFMFVDYAYELFGCNQTVSKDTSPLFNIWLNKLIEYEGEQPKVSFIAPNEHNLAMQSTLYFLSKTASRVREITFPTSSKEIWDNYDVVVTANPIIMSTKPEGKTLIKINTEYNKNSEADYSYDNLTDFLSDNPTWLGLLKLEDW